jgi:hypothetical protein
MDLATVNHERGPALDSREPPARAQHRTLTLQLLCDFALRFMGPDFSLWTIELEQFNRRAVINDESDRHAFAGGL